MTAVQDTLNTRGKIHGDFTVGSGVMQALKDIAHISTNWQYMTPAQKESIEMILHKVGRVLCGNPNHVDHWHDIAGYATLVENILTTGESHPAPPEPQLQPPVGVFGPQLFTPNTVDCNLKYPSLDPIVKLSAPAFKT